MVQGVTAGEWLEENWVDTRQDSLAETEGGGSDFQRNQSRDRWHRDQVVRHEPLENLACKMTENDVVSGV